MANPTRFPGVYEELMQLGDTSVMSVTRVLHKVQKEDLASHSQLWFSQGGDGLR